MESAQERPPYVTFEYRSVEDRDATIKAGCYQAKDVLFAIVTPIGSRDRFEKNADDWIRDLESAVREGRFKAEWLSAYKSIRKDFVDGREIPENGTPIRTWPALSPSEVNIILNANIRTVEDLAQANESALMLLGIGGRSLKQRAESYLATASDTGKVSEQNAKLLNEVERLEATVAAQDSKIKELNKKLEEALLKAA